MVLPLPIPFDVKAYGKVLTWEYGPPGVYYVSITDFEGWVVDRGVNPEIPMQADQCGKRGYDGNLVYFDYEVLPTVSKPAPRNIRNGCGPTLWKRQHSALRILQ